MDFYACTERQLLNFFWSISANQMLNLRVWLANRVRNRCNIFTVQSTEMEIFHAFRGKAAFRLTLYSRLLGHRFFPSRTCCLVNDKFYLSFMTTRVFSPTVARCTPRRDLAPTFQENEMEKCWEMFNTRIRGRRKKKDFFLQEYIPAL